MSEGQLVDQVDPLGRIIRGVRVIERWHGGWRVEAQHGRLRGLRYAVGRDALRNPSRPGQSLLRDGMR